MDKARTHHYMMHKTNTGTTNKTTLNSLVIVGHKIFIESTLILIMKIHMGYIEFQPTFNFHCENQCALYIYVVPHNNKIV